MLWPVIRWLVSWIAYMFVFMAIGSVISIVAIEITLCCGETSDMTAMGFWVASMPLFWALCIIAAVVVIVQGHSLWSTLGIFIPGTCLGSAAVFMAGPLWGSWRGHS